MNKAVKLWRSALTVQKVFAVLAILALVIMPLAQSKLAVAAPKPPDACDDTLDNDGDGLTDFPADLGCQNKNDNDETDEVVVEEEVEEVLICHASASHSNPYGEQSPAESADVAGHDGHNGPVWFSGITEQWGDIIPPFEYDGGSYDGKNWTTEGQAIYNNDCEIPEEEEEPITGTIVVQKEVMEGDDQQQAFQFDMTGGIEFSLSHGQSTSTTVVAGSFPDISETLTPGWSLVSAVCVHGDQSTSTAQAVDVSGDETVTCTFTNDQAEVEGETGTLIVQKVVVNNDGGTATSSDFSFKIDGGATTTFAASGQNELELTLGAHTVAEVTANGYSATYSGACDENGNVTVTSETVTCIITNDDTDEGGGGEEGDEEGTLIIRKIVVNDDGGTSTSSDFSFTVNGGSSIAFEADGENEMVVPVGNYTIVEVDDDGYTVSYENCADVAVSDGETTICTITNNDGRRSSGGGGGGGGSSSGDNDDGEVLGDSDAPGEVLGVGEQIALLPEGAPNTGAGGAAQNSGFAGLVGTLMTVFGLIGLGMFRKA